MKRVLALVTARGGSKGFPGKNLARLAGRELVVWAHHALDQVRRRHPEVVLHLSTDAPEIAAAWPVADRPCRLRPPELAGDTATTLAVIDYELACQAEAGTPCDAVLLLQPTSPLVQAGDLLELLAVVRGGAGAAIGVTPVEHPVAWAHYVDATGRLHPVLGSRDDRRRQDQRQAVQPMGAYCATAGFLAEHRGFLVPEVTVGVAIPRMRAVDIDHPWDLDAAASGLAASRPERPFSIGGRQVGGGAPCLIIAEAGVNHNGDLRLALELVRAAAKAGADAVKFQSFRASELVTAGARKAAYQASNTGADDGQLAMLQALELAEDHHRKLMDEAARNGIAFLSTPFDWPSVEMLHRLDVPAFKLGSGELTNTPLLARIASLGRPLILSSGMGDLDEVEAAAACIRANGDPPTAWLHCVTSYPAPVEQSNLRAIDSLRLALGGPVGMSDHSPGLTITLAAVARGAQVIEKHLTLDRSLPGPDHLASIEPGDFAELVRQVRLVESALGDGVKRPAPCEREIALVARRSLVAARDLPAGHVLTAGDLGVKRPGEGIPPPRFAELVGRRLALPLRADQLVAWSDLA